MLELFHFHIVWDKHEQFTEVSTSLFCLLARSERGLGGRSNVDLRSDFQDLAYLIQRLHVAVVRISFVLKLVACLLYSPLSFLIIHHAPPKGLS